jgi:hypothetical protein
MSTMSTKKHITQIRLDESIYSLVKTVAQKERRSLNNQMEYLIKAGAEQYLKDHQVVPLGKIKVASND